MTIAPFRSSTSLSPTRLPTAKWPTQHGSWAGRRQLKRPPGPDSAHEHVDIREPSPDERDPKTERDGTGDGASDDDRPSCWVFGLGLSVVLLSGYRAAAGEHAHLDREDLLQYHAADGGSRRVTTPAEWQKRRTEILLAVQEVMGSKPSEAKRAPFEIKLLEEVDAGKYVRRLITYQSEPGSRVPAYLCIPKQSLTGEHKAPAVLCLHPTDNKVGHKVVVGLDGREGRQYAAELAERGYVTLSPSYPLLADYQPDLDKLGYASGSMKAIWDNIRGLDLLSEFSFVDNSQGFGAIGHSLGGHNAIFTAVFDPRITVVVSSCGFDSFLDYYGGAQETWRAGKGWLQTRYMPRLIKYRANLEAIPFDFHELLAALAPRRVFINAPLHDDNFRWRSVEQCVAAARPVYSLLGAEDNLTVQHPDCDHNFPKEQRDAAYRAIESVLCRRERPTRPTVAPHKDK